MENSKDVYAHNRHAGASALCMKRRMFIHTKKSYERKNRQGGIEMQFDFDRITDRRNTGSLKWDAAEAELPISGSRYGFSDGSGCAGCASA